MKMKGINIWNLMGTSNCGIFSDPPNNETEEAPVDGPFSDWDAICTNFEEIACNVDNQVCNPSEKPCKHSKMYWRYSRSSVSG